MSSGWPRPAITARSVAELGIEPGSRVVAMVKATNVVVGLPEE